MPRLDSEVRVTLSLLDRLIDYEPEVTQEPVTSRTKNLRQLKQSVKRDLEWLLNTRQDADTLPPDLKEINKSVATYGLPDFTTLSIKNPADQSRMRRMIEAAIRIFEPRLEAVSVTLEPVYDVIHVMRFRIDARLKVEPAPEPVTFDTTLDPTTSHYTVEEE